VTASHWARRFLDLAALVASWSKDPSTKCGAVIVRPDKTICSVGYNGFPKGMPDDEQSYLNRSDKYSRVVHAEVNALIWSQDRSVKGYSVFLSPFLSCDRCFVQLAQAGIAEFVAPKATPEQLGRWGDSFDRVRRYADEMGVVVSEGP
jgi:dCMP deaminase